MIQIWADNSRDAKGLIEHIHYTCDEDYTVKHILTASTEPVVTINGYMYIGFGNICRFFNYPGTVYED